MPVTPKKPEMTEVDEDTPVAKVKAPVQRGYIEPTVKITVTKFGAGKVATGQHEAGFGDVYAKRGDTLMADPATAKRLEQLGFAEAD